MRTIFQWLRWVCLLLLGLAWTTTSSFAAVGALNQANGGLTIRYDALETQNRGYGPEPSRAWDNNPPEMVDASAFFSSPAQFNAAKGSSTALSTFRQTTAGESFLHYGYAEQAAGFAGGLRPGGFTTTASGLTGAEARAGLALPRAVPPNAVYTVTPTPGTTIRVNPVTSPQFGQPGGLPEFQFPLGTSPGTISSPRPIP